jgi:hypothetical protein
LVSLALIYDLHRINVLNLCKASMMLVEKVRAVDQSLSWYELRNPQRLHPVLGNFKLMLPVRP